MLDMDKIERLLFPEVIRVEKDEVTESHWRRIAEDIYQDKDRRNSRMRTFEEVLEDVRYGGAVEHAAFSKFGLEYRPADREFLVEDYTSYAWDIESEGKRVEIKSLKAGYSKNDDMTFSGPGYKTFLKNADSVDYLVVGAVTGEDSESFYVEFVWAFDSRHFAKYSRITNHDGQAVGVYQYSRHEIMRDAAVCRRNERYLS